MGGTRKEKLLAELARLASLFFLEHAGLPGTVLGVTRVEISEDLQHVKIFFSVFPDNQERRVFKEIYAAQKDFKRFLATHLNVKFMPKISLLPDETSKKQRRVEDLLEKLK